MLNISLNPVKSQEIKVSLGGQSVKIKIVQRSTGMYMDVGVGDKWIAQGVLCLNCNKIIRYPYLKFQGELFFADTVGSLDPFYDQLGTRFKLFYASADEVAA